MCLQWLNFQNVRHYLKALRDPAHSANRTGKTLAEPLLGVNGFKGVLTR